MDRKRQLALHLPAPLPSLLQLWTASDIYERLDGGNIEHFVEDKRVEWKSPSVQPRNLAEYLSMWANTQPHGGLVLIGLDDEGKIVGCKSAAQEHLNSIQYLSDLCPDAQYHFKEVALRNWRGEQDFILVLRVHYNADKVVETSAGKAFVREGDNKVEINETVKRELRIAKGEIHHELEQSLLVFPLEFDLTEVEKFCRAFRASRRLQNEKSREELLELAKLGKRTNGVFRPNLACALLFANDPRDVIPGARIRIIRYDGKFEKFGTEMNSVFSEFVDGNVAKILLAAKPIIASQLRSFQRYDDTGRINVQQEYPDEAWFEAVVNAVAHRSYNLKNQNIFVKIFDDRFVVESPGGFVPPTTASTVYDSHNPRNPHLMEAMMHLELTFCGYEGTRRMRSAMVHASLPEPRFKQVMATSHHVHVMLENNIDARRKVVPAEAPFAGLSVAEFMGLSKDEQSIINFLASKKSINITIASLVIAKSWATAQKVIIGLVDKDILSITETKRKKHDASKSYVLKAYHFDKPK